MTTYHVFAKYGRHKPSRVLKTDDATLAEVTAHNVRVSDVARPSRVWIETEEPALDDYENEVQRQIQRDMAQ